ncbi:hypothetical protein N3K66_008033 [Trichothecium roseum]|uniref:Uncharacterized protein n=1 Tax=Trichothecium roseum TaxID=47278 RepID=A0ACC0USD0_9HYPO|nr:hypothetical protein N3K66_008033 [Trichothecium roseum]
MDRPRDAWRPRRRVTDSFAKSRRSDTEDADRLVRWNTAKDIPEEQTQLRIMKPPKRTVSANVSFALPQTHRRRFSWVPHSQEDSQFSAVPPGTSRVEAQPNSDAEEVVPDPPSITADRRLLRVRQNIEARKEVHRKRRDLKESGDYLGPQGINPETGQLDIDTPSTSDGNSENQREEDEMHELRKALKQARDNTSKPARSKERELKRIFVSKEKEKMKKKQQEKNTLSKMHNGLKWKRHTKQWSSAQEPELSPIAQSHQSGTSSRRPSHLTEPRERGDQLIDLASPKANLKPSLDIHTQEVEASESTPGPGTTQSSNMVKTEEHRGIGIGLHHQRTIVDVLKLQAGY